MPPASYPFRGRLSVQCCRQSAQGGLLSGRLGLTLATLLIVQCIVLAHPGLDEDIARTTKLLDVDPDSIELRIQRASLYWMHGEWKEAEIDCWEALKRQPDLPRVELLLANVHIDSGRTWEARERLNNYIKAHSEEPVGWWLRGKAWRQDMRLDKAAADYGRALDIGANLPIVYYLDAATALLEQGPDKAPTAERRIREGLERFKESEVLLQLLQRVLIAQKRFDEALAVLDERMSGKPRQEWRLTERATILVQAGRVGEAIENFKEADRLVNALPIRVRDTRAVVELAASIRHGLDRAASRDPAAK